MDTCEQFVFMLLVVGGRIIPLEVAQKTEQADKLSCQRCRGWFVINKIAIKYFQDKLYVGDGLRGE